MGISGQRFLQLSQPEVLYITEHALERIGEYGGVSMSRDEALQYLLGARQLKVDEMSRLGYRPGYDRRRECGVSSWYFRFALPGMELIAVLCEGRQPGEMVWVTTYGPNPEQRLRRERLSRAREMSLSN